MKRIKVASAGGLNRFLNAMVSRDNDRVRPAHQGKSFVLIRIDQTSSPPVQPASDLDRAIEETGHVLVIATFECV